MSDSLTILEEHDGIAVLTLNRATERNAAASHKLLVRERCSYNG